MHHALTISEIIHEIFTHLLEPHNAPRHHSAGYLTLAALAVTCRTFREPALALRWRQLWSIRPLVPLFPRDIWDESDLYDPNDFDLDIVRLPSQEEWIRFESYASRICDIHIGFEGFTGVINFMVMLSMKYANPSLESHHLFPNLRTLSWNSQEKTALSFAHLFFPPSLRCLTLGFGGLDDRSAPVLLLLLQHQWPRLKQFNISGVFCTRNMLESHAFQQLETLDCEEIDESALGYLAKLTTLKDLSFYLPDPIPTNVAFDEGFVNLQTLSLTADEISVAISFLMSTHIYLLRDWDVTWPQEGTVDIAALRPLFSFSGLRYLHIDGICSFDLSDDSLAELADAWPRLEELMLNHCSGWGRTSEITFKGLKSLIQACPLLQDLALAIDATQLNVVSSTTPGEDIHNDKIETLNLGNSIIGSPAAVALVLGELFWSLKEVQVYVDPQRELYGHLWSEVNSYLLTRQANIQDIGL
ncbi:hypothetical protein BJ138DRAFT_1221252 [Hygrophoropsis aurantiaca]|uniref:Uncharacterized protein n=1 Tax=Hygrophoropsis aurantiaca TaxID=72124 RepID=A0ACB8A0K7_9AGAM|nr:hypothetical protein BJ138DRAFT_1221252 [Hygrophoropsis aurantiaca]